MFLFWLLLIGIVIISIISACANKKYVGDVSNEVLAFIKRKDKRREQDENIQKRVWVWAVLALFIVVLLSMYLSRIIFPLGDATGELFMEIYGKQKWCRIIILLIGIVSIVVYIIYDRFRTSYASQYKVPAYVQRIYTNPKQRTRTAQIVYYDFVGDIVRIKSIPTAKIEREVGLLEEGDMLSIIVEEGKRRVCFVAACEERA